MTYVNSAKSLQEDLDLKKEIHELAQKTPNKQLNRSNSFVLSNNQV